MPSPRRDVFAKTLVSRPVALTHLTASERYAELPPEKIQPRPHKDLRPIKPAFLVELMESILTLELLQPVVVTSDYCLVAGKHRLGAFKMFKALKGIKAEGEERRSQIGRVLSEIVEGVPFSPELIERVEELDPAQFEKKYPDFRVPCKIAAFSSKQSEQVLLGEGVENEKRHDFTPSEILGYYNRLKEQGFIHESRRPREGEKPIMPALSLATGKSIRRLQQLLNQAASAEEGGKSSEPTPPEAEFGKLEREIRRAVTILAERKDQNSKQLVPLLEKSLKFLEKI